jgi:Protein of unknown function (DUF3892)
VPGRYLIHCVIRSRLVNHDRRLSFVGGVNLDGAHWRISEAEAIAAIEEGRWDFFTETAGRLHPVVIAVSKYGQKYLKGASDGLQPESLLTLPECSRTG